MEIRSRRWQNRGDHVVCLVTLWASLFWEQPRLIAKYTDRAGMVNNYQNSNIFWRD